MAVDLGNGPDTGLHTQICGDAHLGNFGFYRSPEGEQVIDLNDFDEAHPGAWEWDLRRLAAAVWVAGRENGYSEDDIAEAVHACVIAYRDEVAQLIDGERLLQDADLQRQGRMRGRGSSRRLDLQQDLVAGRVDLRLQLRRRHQCSKCKTSGAMSALNIGACAVRHLPRASIQNPLLRPPTLSATKRPRNDPLPRGPQ